MLSIKDMMYAIKSNSMIIEGGDKLETITFNPFDIMGVAFLSCYNLTHSDEEIVVLAGGKLLYKTILGTTGKVLIDFVKPILLKVDSKLEIKTSDKCFIHYHIFTPSEREKKLYDIY